MASKGEDSHRVGPTTGRAGDQGAPDRIRLRSFGLARWLGLVLVIGGGTLLSSFAWWLAILAMVVGFVLIEIDNERRRNALGEGES